VARPCRLGLLIPFLPALDARVELKGEEVVIRRVPQVTWVPHSFAYFANEWALRTARVTNGRMATHDKEKILIHLTNVLDRSHHPDNHC